MKLQLENWILDRIYVMFRKMGKKKISNTAVQNKTASIKDPHTQLLFGCNTAAPPFS